MPVQRFFAMLRMTKKVGAQMARTRTFYVYIMTNHSGTLYTGITNNLVRRVAEHKEGRGSEFTSRYKITRLVYFEETNDVTAAIEREKQIKGWLRARKIALIESVNPQWRDLSEDSETMLQADPVF